MGLEGPRLECPEGTVLLSLHRGGSTAYLPCFDYSWSLLCLWERLERDDKPLGNAVIIKQGWRRRLGSRVSTMVTPGRQGPARTQVHWIQGRDKAGGPPEDRSQAMRAWSCRQWELGWL